jgi:hypothetical protein
MVDCFSLRYLLHFITFVGVSLKLWSASSPSPLEEWHRVHPSYGFENRHRVRFGNGQFIALAGSQIQFSTNGVGWSTAFEANASVSDIEFAAGRFVVVGESGLVVTSADGLIWERQELGASESLVGVAYGQGRFVALGVERPWISENGVQWQPGPLLFRGSNGMVPGRVVSGPGRFVATVQTFDLTLGAESAYTEMWSSTNGLNWQQTLSRTQADTHQGLAYGAGKFVFITHSRAWISEDGLAWMPRLGLPFSNPTGLDYADGRFVAFSFNGVEGESLLSADAEEWTARPQGTWQELHSADFGNGLMVAVGERAAVLISTNGGNWTYPYPRFRRTTLLGISVSDSLSVSVGTSGVVLTSTNGMDWTEAVAPTTTDDTLTDVVFGPDRCVIVGGDYNANTAVQLWSEDGAQWNRAQHAGLPPLRAVAQGAGLFAAVGSNGALAASTDGTEWITSTVSGPRPGFIRDIAFGADRFVAIAASPASTVLVSSDGLHWVATTREDLGSLETITFGRDRFVALGPTHVNLSPDGIEWSSWPLSRSYEFGGLTYADGVFAAIVSGATIVTSRDAVGWEPVQQMPAGAVAFGGGRLYAAGSGEIARSATLPLRLEARLLRGLPSVELEPFGTGSAAWEIHRSTSLRDWSLWQSGNQNDRVCDGTSSQPCQFYRVVIPEAGP